MAEDLVSFPRAFISSGVSAVVGSLWLAEDEATAELMNRFYQFLATMQVPGPDQSPRVARALASAQRSFFADPLLPVRWKHPFFWGAFTVVGDSR